jgi:hypothetical protein
VPSLTCRLDMNVPTSYGGFSLAAAKDAISKNSTNGVTFILYLTNGIERGEQ